MIPIVLVVASIDHDTLRFDVRVVVVNKTLQGSVTKAVIEIVLLHLKESLVGIPTVMSKTVDRRHRASAMPAAAAVYEYGLVCRIVYDLQELLSLLDGGAALVTHPDAKELHALRFNEALLVALAVLLKVNDCLHAHRCQIRVVSCAGLSAAIKLFVHATEIFDLNLSRLIALSGLRHRENR